MLLKKFCGLLLAMQVGGRSWQTGLLSLTWFHTKVISGNTHATVLSNPTAFHRVGVGGPGGIGEMLPVIFSGFMWRNHPKLNSTFSSQVLVSSDKRPYRNLTFQNLSARQGSSYCNRAHLNFQAFVLRDMEIVTREVYRVGQKMSYHFSFC